MAERSQVFSAPAAGWAEAELRRRYDDPSTDTDKLIGFHLRDGRAIALQRDVAGVQLWLEDDGAPGLPPVLTVRHYLPDQRRHSNLPRRLKHAPPRAGTARAVLLISVHNHDELAQLLDWYEGCKPALDRSALERLRTTFLQEYPDFISFENAGRYRTVEDDYKRELIDIAGRLPADDSLDAAKLGAALLDLLAGTTSNSNLLGWRMVNGLAKARAAFPDAIETAAGVLARAPDPVSAVAAFVERTWPMLSAGQEGNLPYGDSRTVPTMIAALIHPDGMIGVRYQPFHNAGMALLGRSLFKNAPLAQTEIAAVLDMARAVATVMRDKWDWHPRDLWDVQGFIWVTCQQKSGVDPSTTSQASNPMTTTPNPTNLILYGPPGTGKTYATARRAVALADGQATGDRAAIRARYDELVAAGQVRFVTFHQSYAYEDFVEGLRPTNGENGGEGTGAGFRLEPVPGIFREIASVAEQAMKSASAGAPFDMNGRQVFKMSLGRAGSEDAIFDAAIEGDYVVLGWGGDIDWTSYDNYDAIAARWNEDHPGTNGNDGNISQLWRFRCSMRIGDLVVVSYGNTRFRAIGEITGDYEFAPTEVRDYNHRRRVRWLFVPPEPLPISFYDKPFTMRSCYLLREDSLNRDALALLLPGSGGGQASAAKQFVLVIDEINRGNISKVFGELITLIERDKRLGMDEAMRLRLPYSKQDFGVPANLHIVGTMNTADRSIALLDTALRRRFTFEELMPDPDLPELVTAADKCGVDLPALLTTLNDRIEYLFDREHQIGHAYFLPCSSRDDVDAVMRHKVIPLLAEYFYEDWTKVAAVLGDVFADDGKNHDGGFLSRRALRSPFATAGEGEEAWRYRWSVRNPADFDYAGLTGAA